MTINYYLDSKSLKDDEKSVICFIRGIEKSKTLYINTKIRIQPVLWNSDKQTIKKKHSLSNELNSYLVKLKNEISTLYYSIGQNQIKLDNKNFKELIEKHIFNPEVEQEKMKSVFEVFDLYMESKRPAITAGSYQKYKSMRTHLKNFEIYYKTQISFESMNLDFFDKFLNYGLKKAGHANNTIYKLIKQLKSFLYWALERGYHDNIKFKSIKVKEEKVEIIYLTELELFSLVNLDLTSNLRLNNVRDVFCLSCFTGVRFSDISNLDYNDIKGNTWFLRTQKTKDILEIPLSDFAMDILNKYMIIGKKLPVITNQRSNQYLKELCKLSQINEPTKTIQYKGSNRIEDVKPKHELVSTHTARRTFITLSLEKGMRPETLMEITGHKDYKTMKKYIKITSKVKHNEMMNIWKKS